MDYELLWDNLIKELLDREIELKIGINSTTQKTLL